MRSFPVCNTIFGNFGDDNVCAWTVILLPVVNLLPEVDLETSISYAAGTF